MKRVDHTLPISQPPQIHSPTQKVYQKVQDTISSAGAQKAILKSKVFFEDLTQFFLNIFAWPFHGIILFHYQILFFVLFPLFLPILIITEILRGILSILTCGCWNSIELGPKFSLKDPTKGQLSTFESLVKRQEQTNLPIEEQTRLLYILDSYLEHINKYDDSEFGKKHLQVNALIKIQIDGKPKLFHYLPHQSKATIYQNYLDFIGQNATVDSQFQFTFISLDYSYIFGMMNLRIKTDAVDYHIEKEEKPKSVAQNLTQEYAPGAIARYFRPNMGKHVSEKARENQDFAFWPGNTRAFCCKRINSMLKTHDLEAYQICLADVETLIRSGA